MNDFPGHFLEREADFDKISDFSGSNSTRIAQIMTQNIPNLSQTEKNQIVAARIGQGLFRRNLIYECVICPITGVNDSRFLIASHIKPWRVSDDREKLSGSNGLLLSPHIDHLFDEGWISFGDKEDILVSNKITPGLTSAWAIDVDHKIGKFTDSQSEFLEFHRSKIFRG